MKIVNKKFFCLVFERVKTMARYLEIAEQLQKKVKQFVESNLLRGNSVCNEVDSVAVEDLGHIINLAVRCNPRQSQGVVRENIVKVAMRNYCDVTMTKERDGETGREYNLIHISAKG